MLFFLVMSFSDSGIEQIGKYSFHFNFLDEFVKNWYTNNKMFGIIHQLSHLGLEFFEGKFLNAN